MAQTKVFSKTYTWGLILWVHTIIYIQLFAKSFVIVTLNYEIPNLNFPKNEFNTEWCFQDKR